MSSLGQGKKRKVSWHTQEKEAVKVRARLQCEAPGCVEIGTEWHHTFGRNNRGIPEPYCSSRHMTILICHSCHSEVTRNTRLGRQLQERFEMLGVFRLAQSLGIELLDQYRLEDFTVIGMARVFCEELQAANTLPVEYK